MTKPLHRYEVAATRRVHSPLYGYGAYHYDTRRDEFAYGNGQPYKTVKTLPQPRTLAP